MRELVKREKGKAPPLPEGKYRVFYADPPWRYKNKGLDDYGHAERHYPTMSVAELCAMGDQVKDLATPNSVMFLWVPSPMLENAFKVIKAWGFTYKTSFVWDKIRHNFGHYNSVRHELLLVCTRACTCSKQSACRLPDRRFPLCDGLQRCVATPPVVAPDQVTSEHHGGQVDGPGCCVGGTGSVGLVGGRDPLVSAKSQAVARTAS
jgi:hypothetical protein